MKHIFDELSVLWEELDKESLAQICDLIQSHFYTGHLIGLGAGRMGYSMRAFVMRLSHLGMSSWMIGDTTLPRVTNKSIIFINSSSGETESNVLFCKQAKLAGGLIVSMTTNPKSQIGLMSDHHLEIPKFQSKQLMKTLYEQFSFLLFDYVASELAQRLEIPNEFINHNHSILE